MTGAFDMPEAPALDLPEMVEALQAMRFDPADEAALAEAAPLLAGLARNRDFLGTILLRELAGRAEAQERASGYGAQVVMLHGDDGWFVRANIWPALDDPLVRRNGARRFFYDVAHDHNFSFLTVGYFGPGYASDYYVYDHDAVAGLPGEAAGLRFVERATLGEGRMRLYRAHRDVHCQYAPDATSVSLNLVQSGGGRAFRNQYRFDLAADRIAAQIAHSPAEALLALLPALGGEEGADLLDRFACTHPCERMRFGAVRAQAGAAPDLDARMTVLAAAAGRPGRVAPALARAELDVLQAHRGWIEG